MGMCINNIKHQLISIDSRSRDAVHAANEYKVKFDRIRNVVSIKLVSAIIHNTLVDIDATNNTLDFDITYNTPDGAYVSGYSYTIIVPIGAYSGMELQAAMQSAINNVTALITVTFSERENRFSFAVDAPHELRLLGATGASLPVTMLPVIGFPLADISTLGTIVAPIPSQLRVCEDYLLVHLSTNNVELGNMSTSDGIVNAFAKITTDSFTDQFNLVQSVPRVYSTDSPLPNLMDIGVRIVRRDGSKYDNRHKPNSFTLDIAYLG